MKSSGRITRSVPPRKFGNSTYRDAMKFLLKDFKKRCAYSLMHVDCGSATMEVDHFNPTIKGNARNAYTNLMPSIRHCNGAKSNTWPSVAEEALGLRFLDPTKEHDYGHQIFEAADHRLEGTTPAARFHIRFLGLNAAFLIKQRAARAKLMATEQAVEDWLSTNPALHKANEVQASLKNVLATAIPYIPPPPGV